MANSSAYDKFLFDRAPSESYDKWISRVASHAPAECNEVAISPDFEPDTIMKIISDILSFEATRIENMELDKRSDDDNDFEKQKIRTQKLRKITPYLAQLWWINSEELDMITQKLADRSRENKWRIPMGESGVLKFFVEILSKHELRYTLKIHILRLIGNSCADTDTNRSRITDSTSYITSIINQLKEARLLPFALPVLFNICVDYEPNQLLASNANLTRELIKLISSSIFDKKQPLLEYVSRILALLISHPSEADHAPDTTAAALFKIVADRESPVDLEIFISLINIAISYLQYEKFQKAFLYSEGSLKNIITVLIDSYTRFDIDTTTTENDDIKDLANMRTALIQVLSDVSALEAFEEACVAEMRFSNTLQQWLISPSPKRHLQVCACIVLGNLARTDVSCTKFIHVSQLHKPLITIVSSETSAQILHAALSFLKNLSIPPENKNVIGEAGLFQALYRVWTLDTIPQVKFSAISLGRLSTVGTFENVNRLINDYSSKKTSDKLSPLIDLFEKTDDEPIKMEIARLTCSICRVLSSESSELVQSVRKKFFKVYPKISHHLSFVVSQTRWPVIRSEGWFILALIARFPMGTIFVSHLLQDSNIIQLLFGLLTKIPPDSALTSSIKDPVSPTSLSLIPETSNTQAQSTEINQLDRENALVFVSEILKNSGSELTLALKTKLNTLLESGGQILMRYQLEKSEC